MNRNKYISVSGLVFSLLFLYSCAVQTSGSASVSAVAQQSSASSAASASAVVSQSTAANTQLAFSLDEKNAVEKTIAADSSGTIELTDGKGPGIEVYFPSGSVDSDTALTAAPLLSAPTGGSDVLANGFSITQKDKPSEHLQLKSGAVVMFVFDSDPGENVSVVQYGVGGDTVIPTDRATAGDKTVLVAEVDGFSAYGVAKATQQQIQDAVNSQEQRGYNWVVDIDDTYKTDSGGASVAIMLRMKAINSRGWISGSYTGSAYIVDIGIVPSKPVPFVAVVKFTAPKVSFQFEPRMKDEPLNPLENASEPTLAPLDSSGLESLAPLEPSLEPSLAPLIPDYDYIAQGILTANVTYLSAVTMPSDYTGDANGSGDNAAQMFYSVYVKGSDASLTIQTPDNGPITFKGKWIGYGKDSSAAKTPAQPFSDTEIQAVSGSAASAAGINGNSADGNSDNKS